MITRYAALASLIGVAACGHIPDRPLFASELTEGAQSECPAIRRPTHLLWSRYCDVQAFAADHLDRAQDHARLVDAKNWLTFAAAIYAGSTLLLNPNGLSEVETTDLRETAVGIGVLQLSNQVYNPIGSRDRNRRAYHAYSCVAETTHLALEREVYVRRAEAVTLELRELVRTLQTLIDNGQLSDDMKAKAEAAVTAAQAEIDRVEPQVRAYYNFPNSVVRARDNIHEAVVDASMQTELGFAALIQAMSTTVQENMAFLDKGEAPSEEPEQAAAAAGDEGDAAEAINDIADRIADTQRITPNISTLAANLDQCATVIATGVRPSAPALNDIGAATPPSPKGNFFSSDRRRGTLTP